MSRDLLTLQRHDLALSSNLLLLALEVAMKKSHENQLRERPGADGGEKRKRATKSIFGLPKLEMQES